ncbi:hypothetical protein J6590_009030, partial [Homalodisca vitripennis]
MIFEEDLCWLYYEGTSLTTQINVPNLGLASDHQRSLQYLTGTFIILREADFLFSFILSTLISHRSKRKLIKWNK